MGVNNAISVILPGAVIVEISNQHTPYLLRKAQRIEEYLNQR